MMVSNLLVKPQIRNIEFTENDWISLRKAYGCCCGPFTNPQPQEIRRNVLPELRKRPLKPIECLPSMSVAVSDQKPGNKHYNTPIPFQEVSVDNATDQKKRDVTLANHTNDWSNDLQTEMLSKCYNRVLKNIINVIFRISTEVLEINYCWCRLARKFRAKSKRKKKKTEHQNPETKENDNKCTSRRNDEASSRIIAHENKSTNVSKIQEIFQPILKDISCKLIQTTPGLATLPDKGKSQPVDVVTCLVEKGDGESNKKPEENECVAIVESAEDLNNDILSQKDTAVPIPAPENPEPKPKMKSVNKEKNLSKKVPTLQKANQLNAPIIKIRPDISKKTKTYVNHIFTSKEILNAKPQIKQEKQKFHLDTADKSKIATRIDYASNYTLDDFEILNRATTEEHLMFIDDSPAVNEQQVQFHSKNPKTKDIELNEEYVNTFRNVILRKSQRQAPITIRNKSILKPKKLKKPFPPLPFTVIKSKHKFDPRKGNLHDDENKEAIPHLNKGHKTDRVPIPALGQPVQKEIIKDFLDLRKSVPLQCSATKFEKIKKLPISFKKNPVGDEACEYDLVTNSDSLATGNISELNFSITGDSRASPLEKVSASKLHEFMTLILKLAYEGNSGINLDEKFKILHLNNMEKLRRIWSRGCEMVPMKTIRKLINDSIKYGHLFPIRKGSGKYFLGNHWIMLKPES